METKENKRSFARYMLGAALAAFSLIALLSLISFNPQDPPGDVYSHGPRQIHNLCGPLGSYLAYFLFTYFGLGAFVLLALAILWGCLCISKREINNVTVKVTGVMLLIVCASAMLAPPVAKGLPQPSGMPGLGGIIGAVTASALTGYLAWSGTFIILSAAMVLALLLATDMLALDAVVIGAGKAKNFAGKMVDKYNLWRVSQPDTQATTAIRHRMPSTGAGRIRPPIFGMKNRMRPVKLSPKTMLEAEPPGEDGKSFEPEPATREMPQVNAGRMKVEDVAPEKAQAPAAEKTEIPAPTEIEKPEPPKDEILEEAEEKLLSSQGDSMVEYTDPPLELLEKAKPMDLGEFENALHGKARRLEQGFREFGLEVRVVGIQTGPVITQFELELAPGIKVGRVIGLSDDIAMLLKAPSVRIVAPIPGKSTVGIEVPNIDKVAVRLKDIMTSPEAKNGKHVLPLYLGKDAAGTPLIADLTTMPHVLMAGSTGSGKSVCLNTIVLSLIMRHSPRDVRLIMVDPKMVELSCYAGIPHLLCPVVTDMKKAPGVFEWAVNKMEERYKLLSKGGVRHIRSYNKLGREEIMRRFGVDDPESSKMPPWHLPYIVIMIDELADLMMTAAKEVENSIIRLAQKSRAVGVHIVLATQRPSVDVITGLIKSNMPARISFRVSSKFDSRIVLDQNGADKLLGQGDMLFLPPGMSKLVRAQGTFVSDEEIHSVTAFVKEKAGTPEYSGELVQLDRAPTGASAKKDEFYDQAVEIILQSGRGSVSLLQRRLGIGYSRASRLVDLMAADGLVGEYKGSQAREVLYTLEEYQELTKEHESESNSA